MSFQKIASRVAKLEGKKSQVQIGNIRETIRCLVQVLAEDKAMSTLSSNAWVTFTESVMRRAAAIRKKAEQASK